MTTRRLTLVTRVRPERSVRVAAVVADLRQLSPEALTRCARLIQALAHAESVVRRVEADRMRRAADRAAPAARRAAIDVRWRSPLHDDRYQRATSYRL